VRFLFGVGRVACLRSDAATVFSTAGVLRYRGAFPAGDTIFRDVVALFATLDLLKLIYP